MRITSPETPFCLDLDPNTGLPVAMSTESLDGSVRTWKVDVDLDVLLGGREERDPTGGIRYVDTVTVAGTRTTGSPMRVIHAGTSIVHEVDATLGPLALTFNYRVFPQSPYLEVGLRIWANEPTIVRGLNWSLTCEDDAAASWIVNAPGNCLHRDVQLPELGDQTLGVSPVGGLRGSSAVIAVTEPGSSTLTVWPNTASEIIAITVRKSDANGFVTKVATELGADLSDGQIVDIRLGCLDVQLIDFAELTQQFPDWLARYGFTSPPTKPEWVRSASIYEVQIGTSVFWGEHEYTRYPRVADVTADLDRIQDLGFSVLQIMPKQPYPSYNVHDYYDIDTSYGDRAELEELVRESHKRGMRVILDVLLHGVLDQESINGAVEGVMSGPFADRLDEPPGDSFSADVSDWATYLIAWSRHIMDFAPHWRGGSPERSPLLDEHPDWFYRDSEGNVTSVYTKAFDARSFSWQQYFREAMLFLLNGLEVDGFRFDAPTYNEFANWAPWARHRASTSPLGCISLFVDIRRDIKQANPEALMYTEPSGHLLRRSMDLNYNYDEQWLVTALAKPEQAAPRSVRTAREFAQWIQDRDAFLPPGSLTAHHIDSHDTFWWPAWGAKWRREQFSLSAVRALTAAFTALDGPTMMFTGGEEGIEDVLSAFNGSRRRFQHVWDRPATFLLGGGDNLLHVLRRTVDGSSVEILVNLSGSVQEPFCLATSGRVDEEFIEGVSWDPDGRSGTLSPYGIALRVCSTPARG